MKQARRQQKLTARIKFWENQSKQYQAANKRPGSNKK